MLMRQKWPLKSAKHFSFQQKEHSVRIFYNVLEPVQMKLKLYDVRKKSLRKSF